MPGLEDTIRGAIGNLVPSIPQFIMARELYNTLTKEPQYDPAEEWAETERRIKADPRNDPYFEAYNNMPRLPAWGGYDPSSPTRVGDRNDPIPEELLNAPEMLSAPTMDPRVGEIYWGSFPDRPYGWGTVYSSTRELPGGGWMVYPTLLRHLDENGESVFSLVPDDDAYNEAFRTGNNMGIYRTREAADNLSRNWSKYQGERFGPAAERMNPHPLLSRFLSGLAGLGIGE